MNMTVALKKLVRHTLLAAPIALAPMASSVVLQAFGFESVTSGVAYAEEAKKSKYKTKKSYALSQKTFKEFSKVQEATDANDWKGALQVLRSIEGKSTKFSSFEKANLWNYYAWVNYSLEDYTQAIRYYKKVLAETELSDALKLGTLYTLAQLLMVQEDYRGAIGYLEKWMKIQPIVGADAYALLAQNYYQLNDMKSSLKNINKAVDMYESKDKIPKENWYAVQRAIYFDKGDNKTVIAILKKLVRHYPKATYWKQLSGMYGQEGEEKNQLHSLEVVYMMGALDKEKQLMNLAYLFMGQDAPYKAAKIIDKGMKDKIIPETSKNLEVLASAWRLSQEIKKSIPEMEKAAKKSDKGDLYSRLAGIYLDGDQYDKALKSGSAALKRGGVKRVDQLRIVLGMSNANKGNYEKAIVEFKKASKDKRSKRFALNWIQFCEGEIRRNRQLQM